MATELRESVTRNTATLLVAQMTASDSVSNKRKRTLSQRAGVLQCAKPFSALHSHSQFAIPWLYRTGSVNLHGASGFVLSRIVFSFITRAQTAQKLHKPANYPHKLTKTAEPWLGGGAAFRRIRTARPRHVGCSSLLPLRVSCGSRRAAFRRPAWRAVFAA